ncbi:MAG: Smr/MutS family protein [Hyphomonadaceae bacterium]|nr:Smr/MutS family protein [Hyphomonadaceae bacterium]
MSRHKRELTGEEKKLWRRVAATLKTRRKLEHEEEPSEPAPPPKQAPRAHAPSAHAAHPQPKPKKAAAPPPLQARDGEKRVRRGKLEIGASLDLHGHTQETGRSALGRFLHAAASRGDRTVIVITGVGRGGEGVLKRRLPEWLAEHDLRVLVSGFAPAHRSHGGAGAFYVFLRSRRSGPR